jgi:putative flippase GtrA
MAHRPVIARWIAFNAVGAAGVAVQLGTLALLAHVWHLNYLLSTGLAVEAAVLHNFFWHQRWTWKDRPAVSGDGALQRLGRFHLLNGAISLAGNLALMAWLTGTLHVDPVLANLLAIVGCSLINFAATDALVFRPVQRERCA